MGISADVLRGYTDTILLRRLAKGPSYGYRLAKEVAGMSGGALELKEATLYTAFRRLEAAGLILSFWGDEATGARRRYYSITEAGLARLNEDVSLWLETRSVLDSLIMEEES